VLRTGHHENEENRTVKRTVLILTGIATLGVAAYLGSQSRAQDPAQGQQPNGVQQTGGVAPATAPAPRTRIAVVNLVGVLRNYQKWVDFEHQYKGLLADYDKEVSKQKTAALQLKSDIERATDDATRTQLQQKLKELDRTVQDWSEKYKQDVAKYTDNLTTQVYREIEEAVAAYARSNDIEMVLHYNDAINPTDLSQPYNIQRKLSSAGCMPMYTVPGMDITKYISEMLNSRVRAQAPPSAAPHGN
jgi:Skp family chaperone for outer membrane proteins